MSDVFYPVEFSGFIPELAELPRSPEIIFLHVPKCAGSTFRDILSRVYGELFISTFEHGEKVPDWARCVAGHFPFSRINTLFPDVPKITILRHPVDRVISNFRFLRRSTFKTYTIWLHELRNEEINLAEYARIESEQNVIASYVPVESLARFMWIGFQDYFDQSMNDFFERFNDGQHVPIERLNVSSVDTDEPITDEMKQRIQKLNPRGMEVYQKALELWGPRLGIAL